MPDAPPCLTLRGLRRRKAHRRLFPRAAAVQVRKEQERHDEAENECVRVHRLRALHNALLNENMSAAIRELRDGGGRACASQRCAQRMARCGDVLQRIADNEQQAPQLKAEQKEPCDQLEQVHR